MNTLNTMIFFLAFLFIGTNSVIMVSSVMTTLGVFAMVMGVTIAAFPPQELY